MDKGMTMSELQPEMTDTQKLFMAMTSANTAINDLQATVGHDHKLLVEGNGQKPIKQRVDDIEEYVKGMKFWLRTIAVSIVLGVISFVGYGIVLYVQILPVLEKLR